MTASPTLSEEHKQRLVNRLGAQVVAVAQDSRSQARNRQVALERLQARLAEALAPRRQRRPTQPTQAAEKRRLDSKRRQGERKRARRRPSDED